jgi:hypothetical protein
VTRPWCACGKVRLQDSAAVRIEQQGNRLHVHESPKCTAYRIGSEDSSPKKGRK